MATFVAIFFLEEHMTDYTHKLVEQAALICEQSEIPFNIEVWLDSTKREISSLTARSLASLIRKQLALPQLPIDPIPQYKIRTDGAMAPAEVGAIDTFVLMSDHIATMNETAYKLADAMHMLIELHKMSQDRLVTPATRLNIIAARIEAFIPDDLMVK